MRFPRVLVAVLIGLVAATPGFAQLTLDNPITDPMPYRVVSDLLTNPFSEAQSLHEEIVFIEGAAWLRVYFGDDLVLGEGSYLRITSELDGEVQQLDAEAIEQWQHSTAYFNGDTLRVELIGGPRTRGNRLVIDQLAWEVQPELPIGSCGICGPDDRVSSNEDFAARLLPAGCSSTVYNTQSCLVSAGHCMGSGMVVQFRVPLSNGNCNLNHPPVSDQFPLTGFLSTNGGTGNDWAVMTSGTNNLGERPFERYGAKKPIATTPPSIGQSLTIWGYGVDSQCIFNQTQQTSDGNVTDVGSTHLRHNVDATFGNSGSSLQRNGAEVLAIVTHCPCPNWATRVDHPSFAAARDNLCPENPPQTAGLLSATVTKGIPLSTALGLLQGSDNNYFSVESVTEGSRNSTLTEVIAQSPFTTVSDLFINVEFGPANGNPVFYSVQIFNNVTGLFEVLEFGILSQTLDTMVNVNGIPGANDYVDGAAQIRLRLSATARLPQTPGGFTKLIDHVEVLAQP